VISGGWNAKPVTTTPLDARSFADLLDHRLDRGALGDQIESSEVRRVDGDRHSQWYVPALEGEPPAGERAEKTPDLGLVDLDEVRRQAAFLRAERASAAGRMARPLTGGASSLEETADFRHDREEGAASRPRDYANVVGTAVGTAVHRMMEDLDLEDDLGPQISSSLERAAAELEATLDGRALADAVDRLRTVIVGVTEGSCLARLGSLADSVVGREIAIVASPLEDRGPIGAVTGFVDLVYRDPGDGRLVVADYKTDHVDGEEAIAERSGVYEPQVRSYARALRDALHLDYEPRAELWFLAADRIVRL
jgi:ATP-dependent exoDNAse (exonuclease V) beta subunit